MTPRTLATVAAATSLICGGVGLLAPQALISVFGMESSPTIVALIRLACASYIGYAVLAWLARDLTDAGAWRAVAAANVVSWGLSAVVLAFAMASGLGNGSVWAMIALQAAFAVAWALVILRSPSMVARAA